MRILADLIYLLIAAGISPLVVYRMLRHKRYRAGWANRFGKISRKNPGKKCIWIHAVSVGEVNATGTIIDQLKKTFGDFEIVLSTTTDTGFARANALYGKDLTVFYFPLDFSRIMGRAFDQINPALCLLMELEVWPNFVEIAQELNVPVVVVNGRISKKSFSRYKLIRPVVKNIFCKVTLALAQTDEYAKRFTEIGCPDNRVVVTGSLKYDTAQVTDRVEGADALAVELGLGDERLWIAGATGNDEETILLDVYQQLRQEEKFADLRFAIVPRKPERFDEVAQLIQQRNLSMVRYSQIKGKKPAGQIDKNAVILGDTMGDLRKFYSLATIIFVGRSLVPMGGSDMIEAAALAKCTILGPHAFNFQQTIDALLAGNGAIMVQDKDQLLTAMQKCLTEPDFAQKIAANGREVIQKNQGATTRTIDAIGRLLTTSGAQQ